LADKIIFNRVAIAGVGLIGGSLALAGKRAGIFGKVIGLGRGKENLATALRLGVVDEVTSDMAEAARGADLFFVATPVESIAPMILKAAAYLPRGCVITDGGSVKQSIVRQVEAELPEGLFFAAGHPVAGTEKTGAQAAFADLYKDRFTILTPTPKTSAQALEKVRAMWAAAGSKVVIMTPAEHDEAMAVISHLPHLVAFALMDAVAACDPDGKRRAFSAGGLRDTTRIAGSDPVMWRDIFSMNQSLLLQSLTQFQNSLDGLRMSVESGDFGALQASLERISRARRELD